MSLDGSVEHSRELSALAGAVYGPVEILVNNAGIYPPGGTLSTDGETFDRMVEVNVKAPFFLTAALVPAMIEAGWGVVINLGSWNARLGLPVGTAYASTKGAVETLTRAWAAEFGPQGIRVNAISPGVTFDGNSPVAEVAGPMMEATPLGRMVDPEAVARAAVFLASERRRRHPRHRLGRGRRAVLGPVRRPMTCSPPRGGHQARIIEGAAETIRRDGRW